MLEIRIPKQTSLDNPTPGHAYSRQRWSPSRGSTPSRGTGAPPLARQRRSAIAVFAGANGWPKLSSSYRDGDPSKRQLGARRQPHRGPGSARSLRRDSETDGDRGRLCLLKGGTLLRADLHG